MSNKPTVLYDPEGLIEAELPLDREPYMCLVAAVLAWDDDAVLPPSDCEQIALQLTGHARAVASDVRRYSDTMPIFNWTRIRAEVVLAKADLQLAEPYVGTARCVRQRAQTVKSLYERLDELDPPEDTSPT
ncbi:restriction endonuclease (plasmid) [Streptomyces sp. NBC_01352]|uniref:restriction endonuclease n=1 Tax=Streptomyces sp. NBC_01352 TaxID=2903834 RepID=UPI002E350D14|nr:restriction endonuclease [Streptomyces sp. NBC_01352]